jgi:hypothetical protein
VRKCLWPEVAKDGRRKGERLSPFAKERDHVPIFVQKIPVKSKSSDASSRYYMIVAGREQENRLPLTFYLEVLEKLDGTKGEPYVIDPKAISKERLYGTLTAQPSSGRMRSSLSYSDESLTNQKYRRTSFHGDVDPEWAGESTRK